MGAKHIIVLLVLIFFTACHSTVIISPMEEHTDTHSSTKVYYLNDKYVTFFFSLPDSTYRFRREFKEFEPARAYADSLRHVYVSK